MTLFDGTPFVLGMKVVFYNGREIETSPETHKVDTVVVKEKTVHLLGRIGGCSEMDLNLLYPTQQARIESQVKHLEDIKKQIDEEIKFLQSGGEPKECRFL